jgi:AcrR family transcriptional regulator
LSFDRFGGSAFEACSYQCAAFGLIAPVADYVYGANMAKNGNTVNIESARGNSGERYHHGDLRAALVEEGLKRLKDGPAEGLSLREIARNVGVSATAVYRHFPDKAALLDALSVEGDARLAEAFEKAMAKEKPGIAAFNAMGRAYVHFALKNPSLFRLMMTSDTKSAGPDSRGRAMLAKAIAEMSGGKTQAVLDVRMMRAWAIVHGLAMLMLDGLVPADAKMIEKVLDASVL